jgi:hypothetical protein
MKDTTKLLFNLYNFGIGLRKLQLIKNTNL